MTTEKQQPELLAPAGDEECLRAAVANGADAVYFGLEDFNARRRATNFTLAGLPGTMDYLRRHNVKGYVAFNTLVFSDELPRAADFARGIIEAGADALIVQDLGLMRLIRTMSSTFPIHASTQTTQTHADGIARLAELGVSRVILARELSIADINAISERTRLELEVFVHGALCVSYSGQCLASESLWGRSGNRGMCAQACRLPYELVIDGRVQKQTGGDHLLSPHDLAAYDRIGELLAAGVTAFKIEGRLKNAGYVASVTAIYREAIDKALRGERFSLSPERQEELDQSFSRGFTHGFLDGNRHQELISARSPKSRGVQVGRTIGRTSRGIIIEALTAEHPAIKPGDGVVFEDGGPDSREQGGRVYSVQPCGPRDRRQYEITFGREDVELAEVHVGSDVYKTDDPAVRRRVETSFSRDRVARPATLTARVTALVGKPLDIVLADSAGRQVTVQSAEPLARAERHPLSRAVLTEQLSRLGDTPFELMDVVLIGEDGPTDCAAAMVPKSVLNDLRRRATQELTALRAKASLHAIDRPDALDLIRRDLATQFSNALPESAPHIHVVARTLEQFGAVCEMGTLMGTLFGDFDSMGAFESTAEIARRHKVRFGFATPQVLKPDEDRCLNAIAKQHPAEVLVRNLASAAWLRQHSPDTMLVGDFSLNVANEITAGVLRELGLSRITIGYDVNLEQVTALKTAIPGMELELIVHAHVPMFHTAYCMAAAHLSKGNSCRDCGRPCSQHLLYLRDRNGEQHPLRTDATGRTTIFSRRPQGLVACGARSTWPSLRHWRVELLDESASQACELVNRYLRLAGGDAQAAGEIKDSLPALRSGTLEHS
jgi:putative protease